MAMVKTDWSKDNLTKLEGVMLHCSCRQLCFSGCFYDTVTVGSACRIPVVDEKSGEAVQKLSPGLEILKFATCDSSYQLLTAHCMSILSRNSVDIPTNMGHRNIIKG